MLGVSEGFLNKIQRVLTMQESVIKRSRRSYLCSLEDTMKRVKREEDYIQYVSLCILHPEYIYNSSQLLKGSQLQDWQEMLPGTYFTKEVLQKADKHMKSCSRSLVITEIQIKTITCHQYTHTEMGNADSAKC